MSEHEILVEILRRFTEGDAYYCWGERGGKGFLTLDGTVDLSAEELATLSHVLDNDGRGWWNKSGQHDPRVPSTSEGERA